ncbi:MAG: hypothetical protein AAGN66_16625 [Acidobacteriota bacterium]
MNRRRGVNDIQTLGARRQGSPDHRALLRASVIEAELNRLAQERRLLEQRLDGVRQRGAVLLAERDRLLGGLGIRRPADRGPLPSGFQLRY